MSTDARLQERPISQTILPQPRRTPELSALPIPHVPARSSRYAALPPYASNRNGSRYPGSRLTDRLRTLRTQLNAQARALTEPQSEGCTAALAIRDLDRARVECGDAGDDRQ